ncbi:MAG: DUF2163 domain-containing protein [Kordiimonadaceae bacterium]|nr:DUF2163 domain-containing protein [Kordiimonadaceae bacterium]
MLALPGSLLAALKSTTINHAWLVEIPGGLYFTDFETDITLGGKTYLAGGGLLKLPTIRREMDMKRHDITLAFANEDMALFQALTASNLTGQICSVSLVLLDSVGAVISGAAIGMYQGTLHATDYKENTENVVTIKVAGTFSKPNQTAGRFTSANSQLDRHAGDNFFEFAHERRDHLGWGAEE